ncbi:NADH dehydrogenase [ubiquinone] iron-sulfur protein 5 [Anastrepha ludens]|uniref:NADH dehydrogenase [ubiquinone] iron-sulfur protein 5 n=1 Tax=Anastrepha ludens TaxID=28586 RepID=UPI0023B1A100|nr:NADH dehydrogenase [ubiquinone] iron-sulfur protein 5 [Anastrepha ludens]
MSLGPFLRTPFTDLTGCLINHQSYEKCGKMEMEMMECLEAYGVEKGQKMCADIIADFSECVGVRKQLLRFHAMRGERLKQYYFGDRKKDELFAEPPRADAY